MRKFRWISAAALLAGMAILGATPARAALVLTITQDGNGSISASMDTTTGTITPGPTSGTATGTFTPSINPITGEKTLAFNGTVGSVFFDLSVAATTNTPGTPTLAKLNLSSNTITNLDGAGQSFSISSSATGYTAPTGDVTGEISNSGTLTTGSISAGSFTGTADGHTFGPLTFAATGTAVSLANNPPGTPISGFPTTSPYTMSETLAGTLGANSSTASLGGTLVITVAPEPSTVAAALTGVSLVGLGALRRRFLNRV